jgi:hypothetical protein
MKFLPQVPQDLDLPLPFPERVRWVHNEVLKTFGRSDSSAVLIQVPFMIEWSGPPDPRSGVAQTRWGSTMTSDRCWYDGFRIP